MAVAIRLKRTGRKHRPFYRIDAIEKRNARGGRTLENIGLYDPLVRDVKKQIVLDVAAIQAWIDRGARPSHRVASFLRKTNVKWGDPTAKSRKSLLRKRRAEKRKLAGAELGEKTAKKKK